MHFTFYHSRWENLKHNNKYIIKSSFEGSDEVAVSQQNINFEDDENKNCFESNISHSSDPKYKPNAQCTEAAAQNESFQIITDTNR